MKVSQLVHNVEHINLLEPHEAQYVDKNFLSDESLGGEFWGGD